MLGKERVLVVYYSRTGRTRQVAETLCTLIPCDIEEIIDTTNRSGVSGFLRSSVDASLDTPARIQAIEKTPADYDLVIVGTPVWNSGVATPIRAYLQQVKGLLRNVAFFCTYEEHRGESAFEQMTQLSAKTPIAILAITLQEVSSFIHEYHGVSDLCISVPIIVNRTGVKAVLTLPLDAKERNQFRKSASVLRKITNSLDL